MWWGSPGCLEPLRRGLDALAFDPTKDRLWLVGDLVNQGPDSLGTLRFLRSLGEPCRPCWGIMIFTCSRCCWGGAVRLRKTR